MLKTKHQQSWRSRHLSRSSPTSCGPQPRTQMPSTSRCTSPAFSVFATMHPSSRWKWWKPKHSPVPPDRMLAHNQKGALRLCLTDTQTITDASNGSGVEACAMSTQQMTLCRTSDAIKSARVLRPKRLRMRMLAHNQKGALRLCLTDTQTITDASNACGVEACAMSTQQMTLCRTSDTIKSANASHATVSHALQDRRRRLSRVTKFAHRQGAPRRNAARPLRKSARDNAHVLMVAAVHYLGIPNAIQALLAGPPYTATRPPASAAIHLLTGMPKHLPNMMRAIAWREVTCP